MTGFKKFLLLGLKANDLAQYLFNWLQNNMQGTELAATMKKKLIDNFQLVRTAIDIDHITEMVNIQMAVKRKSYIEDFYYRMVMSRDIQEAFFKDATENVFFTNEVRETFFAAKVEAYRNRGKVLLLADDNPIKEDIQPFYNADDNSHEVRETTARDFATLFFDLLRDMQYCGPLGEQILKDMLPNIDIGYTMVSFDLLKDQCTISMIQYNESDDPDEEEFGYTVYMNRLLREGFFNLLITSPLASDNWATIKVAREEAVYDKYTEEVQLYIADD